MSNDFRMNHVDVEEHRKKFNELREQFSHNLRTINKEKKRLYGLVYKNSSTAKVKYHHHHHHHKRRSQRQKQIVINLSSTSYSGGTKEIPKYNSDREQESDKADNEDTNLHIINYDKKDLGASEQNPVTSRTVEKAGRCENCDDVYRHLYNLQNFLSKNHSKSSTCCCQSCLTCGTFLKYLLERNFHNWKLRYSNTKFSVPASPRRKDAADKDKSKCREVHSAIAIGNRKKDLENKNEAQKRDVYCLKKPVTKLSLSNEYIQGEHIAAGSLYSLLKSTSDIKNCRKTTSTSEPTTHCCNYCYKTFTDCDKLRAHIQANHCYGAYTSRRLLKHSSVERKKLRKRNNQLKTIIDNIHKESNKKRPGKRPVFRP